VSDPTPREEEALRRLLRGLPDVAPPEGFYEALIRRRRRRARAIALGGLGAAAVVGLAVVAQATGITGDARLALDELVGRHDALALSADPEDVSVPAPYQAPEDLGPLHRGGAMRQGDGVQVLYRNGELAVSVFEQAGDLDEGDVPADASPLPMEGAWMAHDDGANAVIVRRSHVVYVVIGDAPVDELVAVAEDLPDARPMSMPRRIGDAMDDLVQAFGFS